jgi:hypothetical protein
MFKKMFALLAGPARAVTKSIARATPAEVNSREKCMLDAAQSALVMLVNIGLM